MAIAFKSSCFLQLNKPQTRFAVSFSSNKPVTISFKRFTPVAAIKTMETIGLSETFSKLKKQGKVSVLILPPLQIISKNHFLGSLNN
jgi:tryptophan synthase alpha chain